MWHALRHEGIPHPIAHNLFRTSLAGESDPGSEIDNASEAEPNRFHAGFTVIHRREEAAGHGNQVHYFDASGR